MIYYKIFPEVAGGLGPKSIIDTSSSPPIVIQLNYQFDGWLGNDLLEVFPCFIVTERLKNALSKSNLSGFYFSDVIITKSDIFIELMPQQELPSFYWFHITGKFDYDDFCISKSSELLISSQAKDFLSLFNIGDADIRRYK